MSIGRRRAAEASFGIGDSSAREIGLGAQAVSRARGALRPRELFVSRSEGGWILFCEIFQVRKVLLFRYLAGAPDSDCAQSSATP